MKIAYLADSDSIGGGMEYIRRHAAMLGVGDEAKTFFADRGECRLEHLEKWGPDVISVNHLKALVQLFSNPFRRPAARIDFIVHGVHLRKYDFLPKTPANRMKRRIRLELERRLYRRCDRLVVLTQSDAMYVRKTYGHGLNVEIEPNTNDAANFIDPGELKYGRDSFAFACIARFDFQKGQDILLKAICAARDSLSQSGRRVLMIGDGKTLPDAKRYVAENGISALVEFPGAIPDAGAYMVCAKTLVAPSRWEGMPYLLLEAVARKRHVIASDCVGNREVLENYSDAQLFDVEDVEALSNLLKGEESCGKR